VLIRERLLSLEKPVETALLASLAGIKCYYGNQWHSRLKDNADKLSTILQGSHFVHFMKLITCIILLCIHYIKFLFRICMLDNIS